MKPISQLSLTQFLFRFFLPSILSTSSVFATQSALPNELLPIDSLQQSLSKKHPSKQARTLKKAYSAFENKKFGEAIRLSSKLASDDTFSDYGNWISAAAYRGQAADFLDKKNYSATLSTAQRAVSLSLQIENKNPYSPFLKNIPRDIAQAELLMGSAYSYSHKWQQTEQTFERAFQRLQMQNLLVLVKAAPLEHYAQACKKKPGHLCTSWLQKFSTLFAKKPEEIQAISQHFPSIIDLIRPILPSSRGTQGYKARDLDQVAFESSMKLFSEESYKQATEGFHLFLNNFPRSAYRYRVRYWLAQSLSHEKENEPAQKVYEDLRQDSPLTYYGLLASNATGQPIDSVIQATLPMALDSDPSLLPNETFHLNRAEAFLAEKAYDLAAFELKTFKIRDGISSPFLVYLSMLNYNAKNYNNNFQIMGELIQRKYNGIISSYGLRMIFPVEFLSLIKKYASLSELDPILVLSLIKQESAFDEEANSPSGAMGLMQLMPATAYETDPKVNLPELLNADSNISVGTKYLKKLLTRFNGNIVYSLAGYNAGPNAVDRWIKESPQKRGILEFIEAIPYKETREYVGSIIRNYYWYSQRLNGDTPKDLNYFWNIYGPPEMPARLPETTPSPSSAPQLSIQHHLKLDLGV